MRLRHEWGTRYPWSDTLMPTYLDQNAVSCPCRDHEPSTFDRPALFLPLILIMFVGAGILFAVSDRAYGVRVVSLIPYTAFIV
jgi:hypothetical protein